MTCCVRTIHAYWPCFWGLIRVKILVRGFSRVLIPEGAADARVVCAHGALCGRSLMFHQPHLPLFLTNYFLTAHLFIVTFNRSYATITGLQVLIIGWAGPVLAGSKTKWSSDADVILYSK